MAKQKNNNSGGNLGFEDKLWAAADKLRGNMDAAEYKHVVLGLIFLKYISDAFTEKFTALQNDKHADPEDKDEYLADNIFWVPPEARWDHIQKNAKRPEVGTLVDDAMASIEGDNNTLKGVLPKDYARRNLDKTRLGELIDLIATIGLGDKESRQRDILGRVYEYFLGKFAEKEGKGGGEFYTPACVVRLLVEMIEPFNGRVFDPCCGSGGMFVQAIKFVEAHASGNGNGQSKVRAQRKISIYGQESNYTTWRLALMNLVIRGIEADIRWNEQGSFLKDAFPDLKADFILANPPFNMSDWGGERLKDDTRWRHGVPPKSNANFAWVQHMAHHLAPNGKAGFVLANGSLSSNQRNDAQIRKAMVDDDLVDCVVYLPPQLFYTTQISVSLWFLSRNKAASGERKRKGETLFIYAYDFGRLTDRTHRELTDHEIEQISGTYRAWRGGGCKKEYRDIPGFCRSSRKEDIGTHAGALVPGRYVGFDRQACEPPSTTELRKELDEIRARLNTSQSISRRAMEVLEEVLNG